MRWKTCLYFQWAFGASPVNDCSVFFPVFHWVVCLLIDLQAFFTYSGYEVGLMGEEYHLSLHCMLFNSLSSVY